MVRPGYTLLSRMPPKKQQPITATSNRHSDPHRASHSFKAVRSRCKESQTRSELGVTYCRPRWARQRLGWRVSTMLKKMQTSPCPAAFWREPQEYQSQGIRHRIIDHHSRCLPTDPLPAYGYGRWLVRLFRGCTWCLGKVMPTKIPLGRESRMKGFNF